MTSDPIIRVVLTREIVYQGPASWVRQTLSRRIMAPTLMGLKRGTEAQIVAARDLSASSELGPDFNLLHQAVESRIVRDASARLKGEAPKSESSEEFEERSKQQVEEEA